MSASLVKRALELVEDEHDEIEPSRKSGKISKNKRKFTVEEAKRGRGDPKNQLEENLKKLELIKQHSRVVLNEDVTRNIIERATSQRQIKTKKRKKKKEKTAFTEEDFKKFEEEYLNS